jgi:hypothetical protein
VCKRINITHLIKFTLEITRRKSNIAPKFPTTYTPQLRRIFSDFENNFSVNVPDRRPEPFLYSAIPKPMAKCLCLTTKVSLEDIRENRCHTFDQGVLLELVAIDSGCEKAKDGN